MATDAWGIDDGYSLSATEWREISEDTRALMRRAMKPPAGLDTPPPRAPVWVVERGQTHPVSAAGAGTDDATRDIRGTLRLESGDELSCDGALPASAPSGYHRFFHTGASADDEGTLVIVSPRRCPLPDAGWCFAAQVYSARTRESWGIGDLVDLDALGRWSRDLGARSLLLNPLGPAMPTLPQQPSPYFISSRRFINPLYLRVEAVEGAREALGDALDALARAGRAHNQTRAIDRDAIYALKIGALERVFAARAKSGASAEAFAAWRRQRGRSLERYATFNVICEQRQAGWPAWPDALRHPDNPAVAALADEHAERVTFHAWLQYQLDRQLADAGSSVAIIHDLPVGFDLGGADGWEWQDVLSMDVAVGAPPDPLALDGQNWGVPPFIPWKLRAAGYAPFIDTLRALMAHGGGLRMDHVMSLSRLFWVPHGESAQLGAYVRYDFDAMLAIVALEAERAGAFVVGEDLGTVEEGVREALGAHNILSYRLLYFEDTPTPEWPRLAMAAVTTHDLPTVAGLWTGSDVAEQRALGVTVGEEGTAEIRRRLRGLRGRANDGDHDSASAAASDSAALAADALGDPADVLDDDASAADVVRAAYARLADAPSLIRVVALEDALVEPTRPNIPGTVAARNWSIALPRAIEEVRDDALVAELARGVSRRADA
ncbi:MAG: 4-alpha-glucanotransferase [Myxococcales bacterium]|nr:4-alpha-glucanotransferase [Myxococcales bacterium]